MGKERIDIGGEVFGPYSPGVKANGTIWLSGQISLDSGESAREQTLGCLGKIDQLLKAAGASKHDICFVQVLLDDIHDYAEMNEVYGNWLKDVEIAPARAAFEAANLPKGAKVEIVIQAISTE
ncbi:MAG: RidA family protein [Candidatus Thermoplasmatota archaeon]|jgi:2-iminobutanoate/2-iminopropanoate deaminase|nr:RidA family protein [Candidatus Thermoplasmatota archaeon]MEC7390987.1 RidA family protein [Candidatus Thermoplasmatota archaeon]MEC7435956.1 RidA family protein [Candidatus Thermoplasmatota archaeon]MEC7601784.1 RidA family protein [Candidatus Thermoplasmatota archaeon]MEC7688703.1 RidA family protein [Candidatus Thermoplasmatota archaeon]|tara:strand:- start:3704 stop:4072 length:369 start_codon:yes stop_codon:yes gene_type:complete